MQYRKLGKTALEVSKIGFGGATLGNEYGDVSRADGVAAVHTAIDMGINLFDVSPYYGLTLAERVLGEALRGIPRSAYLVSTKVGRYGRADFDFSAKRVTASVDESLGRLGLDYVDIIICHDIEFGSLDQIVNETIPALHRVREQGKVRYIGISGLPLKIFREVSAQTDLDIMLSYCHYTLVDTTLADLIPDLEKKGIGIINASPLGMGLLSGEAPPEWHPASETLKNLMAAAAAHCQVKGTSIANAALKFSIANPHIATTLVGMKNVEEVKRNVQAAQEPLDEVLTAELQEILSPARNQTWMSGRPENNDVS